MSAPETVTDVLRAARDVLSEPGAWCQDMVAKDAHGRLALAPNHPLAVQWCSLGAIERGIGAWDSALYEAAEDALLRVLDQDVASFNDAPDRTLDEVLDIFALAIKRSEESP